MISVSKKKKVLTVFLLVFLLSFFLYVFHQKEKQRTVLEKYDEIIIAIEKFHIDRGVYPADLKELVGDYIPALPSSTDDMRVDFISYEAIPPNQESKWNDKIFIGTNIPPFTLTLWRSGGLSGDTFIRYCPKQYDCRFIMEVSVPIQGSTDYTREMREFDAERLTDNWVRLKDY